MSYSLVNKNNTGMGFWFFVARKKKEEKWCPSYEAHRHLRQKGIPSLPPTFLVAKVVDANLVPSYLTIAARVPRCNESYGCFSSGCRLSFHLVTGI